MALLFQLTHQTVNIMNKVAIIGSAGVPANYGGFETLAHQLVEEQSGDYELTVYCDGAAIKGEDRLKTYKGADLRYIPLPANGPLSTVYDAWSMIDALFYANTLLILGVSGCLFLPIIRLFFRGNIVVNIDGVEWRREKWGFVARNFIKISEYAAIKFADKIITDNKALQDLTEDRYGCKTTLIEYGSDHVKSIASIEGDCVKYPFLREPYAVKVCRIEPENNIETVLEAFSKVPFPLVLVGNWEVSEYAESLRNKYADCANLHLLDPIYNRVTIDMIRSNALVYIHGHSAGGTNPSLVEAMAFALPVLAFDVSFNRETTENQAKYFETAADLDFLMSNSELWIEDGLTMKNIANRRYTWKRITGLYEGLFLQESSTVKSQKQTKKTQTAAA